MYILDCLKTKSEVDRKRCLDSRTVLDRRELSPQESDYRIAMVGFENCGILWALAEGGVVK